MSNLDDRVRVLFGDAGVVTVPLVDNLTSSNAAPKASTVGAALDQKVGIDDIMEHVTIKINELESDNQGVILMNGEDLPANSDPDAPTVAEQLEALDGKTAADIPYVPNGEDSVKDKIDTLENDVSDIQDDLYGDQIPIDNSSGAQTIKAAIVAAAGKTANDIIYENQTTIKDKVDGIASDVSDLQGEIDGVVRVAEQTFTAAQQGQARTNIGAMGVNEGVQIAEQNLTAAQQGQVRTNIGAMGANEGVQIAEQSLTAAQQTQVRENVGAASSETLESLLTNLRSLTSYEYMKVVDSVSINSGSTYEPEGLAAAEKAGYIPRGICGYRLSSGSNKSVVLTRCCMFSAGNIGVAIKNIDSSAATVTLEIWILYVRTFNN